MQNSSISKQYFETGPHNILLFFSIIGFLIFLYATFNAFSSQLDIRIVSRETVCAQPLNNRCRYQYTVKETDGRQGPLLVSGFVYDADDLIAGNSIRKERYSFQYEVNGHPKFWPFATSVGGILLLSIAALALWMSPRVRLMVKSALR